MRFVQASLAITVTPKLFPVAGAPAEKLKPFEVIDVILYEATFGPLRSKPKLSDVATSLQMVAD